MASRDLTMAHEESMIMEYDVSADTEVKKENEIRRRWKKWVRVKKEHIWKNFCKENGKTKEEKYTYIIC